MKAVLCPVCGGRGTIMDYGNPNFTSAIIEVTCRGCGGKGWVEVHEDATQGLSYDPCPSTSGGNK